MKFYKLFFAFFFLNFQGTNQVNAHDIFGKIKTYDLLEKAKFLDHQIFWGSIFIGSALYGYRIGNSIDNIKAENQPKVDAVNKSASTTHIQRVNSEINKKIKPYEYGLWPILGIMVVSGLRFISLEAQK